jgi:hypothetical protein
METKQHIFTDLGQAPYRLVAVLEAPEPSEMYPKPGLTCDHCGTYIPIIFKCESSDHKSFVIGSTCVEKLGDKGLIDVVKAKMSERRRELRRIKEIEAWEAAAPQREAARLEREAAEAKAQIEAEAEYDRVKPLLANRPHPNAFFASKGKTMLDYVEYCGPKSFPGLRAIREVGGNV